MRLIDGNIDLYNFVHLSHGVCIAPIGRPDMIGQFVPRAGQSRK